VRALRSAFAYFSIAPIRVEEAPGAEALDAFPFVGIAIGALAGSIAAAVARVAPRSLATATAFALPIVFSGALHVDGFLDASDALFVEMPVERRLEILKDPHAGSFAVASFAIVSVFSIAALQAIEPRRYPFALAFAGGMARVGAIANAYRRPYGRKASSSQFFTRPPSPIWLAIAGTVASLMAMRTQRCALRSSVLVLASGYALGAACSRRLGGKMVGDAYGFIVVALEPLALATCAAFARD
jgi:adenosylcobinamide-GDP ribazoletransferase